MRHADEGILHSYLDGELTPAEVTELERHLSICAPCRVQLAEARSFLTTADDLVVALDVPHAPTKPFVATSDPHRWRPRLTTLAWAATIVVAVGLGYSLRPQLAPPREAQLTASPAPTRLADTPTAPAPAVVVTPRPTHQSAKATGETTPASSGGTRGFEANPAAEVASGDAAPAPRANELDRLADRGAVTTSDLQRQATSAAPVSAAAGASGIAMVDGTPVDTTLRSPTFGPANAPAPKRITLDEAVARLGGSIRLIDGLAPQRVELISGVDVPGADPDRQVIRVYYEEPDLGLVTLDQQRPGPSFAARDAREDRNEAATPSVTVVPAAPLTAGRMVMRAPLPSSTISWRSDGVWLSLTSHRAGVKMNELQARVK